jgi:hypothetical protein
MSDGSKPKKRMRSTSWTARSSPAQAEVSAGRRPRRSKRSASTVPIRARRSSETSRTLRVADQERRTGLRREPDELLRLLDGRGHRLLHEKHAMPEPHRGARGRGQGGDRRGDDDDVGLGRSLEVAEVRVFERVDGADVHAQGSPDPCVVRAHPPSSDDERAHAERIVPSSAGRQHPPHELA